MTTTFVCSRCGYTVKVPDADAARLLHDLCEVSQAKRTVIGDTTFTVEEMEVNHADPADTWAAVKVRASRGDISLTFWVHIPKKEEVLFLRAHDALFEAEGIWTRRERDT